MESPNSRAEEILRRRWRLVLAALFAAALLARLPNISDYLDVDSADYVHAARMGFWANALDYNSRPLKSLLTDAAKVVLLKADIHIWADDAKNNDVTAYRYYHPPLFYYLLGFWIKLFGTSNAALTLLPTLIGAATAPILFWAWMALFPQQSRIPGLVAAFFAAVDPLLSSSGKYVKGHTLFALLALLALVFFARALRDRNTRDLNLSAVLLGLCFATLEYTVFLAACCALALVLVRNPWVVVSRQGITITTSFFVAVLLTFLVFALAWPAGVLKLDFIKGYLLQFRLSGRAAYEVSLGSVLKDVILAAPVMGLFCLAGAAVGLGRLFRGEVPGWLLPLILFPLLIFAMNLPNATTKPTFFAPIQPYFILLAAWGLWALVARAGRYQAAACGVILLLCLVVNTPSLLHAGRNAPYFWPQVLRFFETQAQPGDRVLAFNHLDANVLAYYQPELVVDRAFGWPSAMQETKDRIRRGEYRFVALIGYQAPAPPRSDARLLLPGLPYYADVQEFYRPADVIKRGPDELVVELFERKQP